MHRLFSVQPHLASNATPKSASKNNASGVSFVEALIALVVAGFLAVLSLNLLINPSANETYETLAQQYVEHLSTAYRTQLLKTGLPPIHTSTPNGLAAILPVQDGSATYTAGPPETLDYPGEYRVYLQPEQLESTVTGINATILAGTDNREWFLLDMDPGTTPSNLATDGDLVLLRVNNATGAVQTAHEVDSTTFATPSFLD